MNKEREKNNTTDQQAGWWSERTAKKKKKTTRRHITVAFYTERPGRKFGFYQPSKAVEKPDDYSKHSTERRGDEFRKCLSNQHWVIIQSLECKC